MLSQPRSSRSQSRRALLPPARPSSSKRKARRQKVAKLKNPDVWPAVEAADRRRKERVDLGGEEGGLEGAAVGVVEGRWGDENPRRDLEALSRVDDGVL